MRLQLPPAVLAQVVLVRDLATVGCVCSLHASSLINLYFAWPSPLLLLLPSAVTCSAFSAMFFQFFY